MQPDPNSTSLNPRSHSVHTSHSPGYCVHERSAWASSAQSSAWCGTSSDKVTAMTANPIWIIIPSTEPGKIPRNIVSGGWCCLGLSLKLVPNGGHRGHTCLETGVSSLHYWAPWLASMLPGRASTQWQLPGSAVSLVASDTAQCDRGRRRLHRSFSLPPAC